MIDNLQQKHTATFCKHCFSLFYVNFFE